MFLSIAVVTLAGASLFGAATSFAQGSTDEGTSLVQKIATKFGLSQSDVQAVFDEHREERHIKLQVRFDERLMQLVADGKITEEQKAKILEKFAELKEQKVHREEFKNMTRDERKAAYKQKHEELKAWAEANGIDLEILTGAFGHGKGMVKHNMR